MPAGVRLFACDEVDSTNAEALRLQDAGENGPFWVSARSQTGGRGRQGRRWISEPGNLYASMLLRLSGNRYNLTQLSFVAGLAVFDATRHLLGTARPTDLALKWPNDLLLEGAKLAGILLESEGGCTGSGHTVVIGIGLNLVSSPDTGLYPATCLARHGIEATPGEAMELLAVRFSSRFEQWSGGQGFSAILAEWKSHAAGLGEAVTVRGPSGDMTGTFSGLDDNGALVLRDAAGRRHKVLSGDLFLEPAGGLPVRTGRTVS